MVRWNCFCRSLAKGVSSDRYADGRQSDASGHRRACSVEGCTDSDHQIPLIQHAGAPATGTAAHFTCKNCGLLFDAEKRETTPEALVLPKFDHTIGEALESDAEAHWYACGEKSAVFTRTFA